MCNQVIVKRTTHLTCIRRYTTLWNTPWVIK